MYFPTIGVVWLTVLVYIAWKFRALYVTRLARIADPSTDDDEQTPAPEIDRLVSAVYWTMAVGFLCVLFVPLFWLDGKSLLMRILDPSSIWSGASFTPQYLLGVLAPFLARIGIAYGLGIYLVSSWFNVGTNEMAIYRLFGTKRWRGGAKEGPHLRLGVLFGWTIEQVRIEITYVADDAWKEKKDEHGQLMIDYGFINLGIRRAADSIPGSAKSNEPQPTLLTEKLTTAGLSEALLALLPEEIAKKLRVAGGATLRYKIDFRFRVRNGYRWLSLDRVTRALIVKAIQDLIETMLKGTIIGLEYGQALSPVPHILAWCNPTHFMRRMKEYRLADPTLSGPEAWEKYYLEVTDTNDLTIPDDCRMPKREDVETERQLDAILDDKRLYPLSLTAHIDRQLGVALHGLSIPDVDEAEDIEKGREQLQLMGFEAQKSMFEGQKIARLARSVAEEVMRAELEAAIGDPEATKEAQQKLARMIGEYIILLETFGVLKSGRVNLTALGGLQGLPSQFLGALSKIVGQNPPTN